MSDLLHVPQAGSYRCVVSDPPWHHATRSPKGQTRRSPSHHYETMPLDAICALPVREVAARDCHLFLWTTQPHLQQAFRVIEAWGFRYSSVHTFWVKLTPKGADSIWITPDRLARGMGFTTRKNVELLLLGRRGAPRRLVKDMGDVLFAGRRQHSRKPDESFARVERYCAGPRLEMFSRERREGWDAFGLEVGKFTPALVESATPFGPPHPFPTTPLLDVAA